MTVVAVIPARGGSQGIPGKNMRKVGGQSLLRRAVTSCTRAQRIDAIFVSTDDDAIALEAMSAGAGVVRRPSELASHTASSEAALLHALDEIERSAEAPTVLVFVQCTSPFIDPLSLDRAIEQVLDGAADVVFSALQTYEFLWALDDSGVAHGINHDPSHRPRRQDREPHYRETGAFYVMEVSGFRKAQHRFFGRVCVEPVAAATAIEVDEPHDLAIANATAAAMTHPHTIDASRIRALVMDFDGVHTDDRVYIDDSGREMVVANRSDGHGIKLLREAGMHLLILSAERNPVVARRAEKLGVECRHGIDDKLSELDAWRQNLGLEWDQLAYIGNDVNDLTCLRAVGLPIAVADAHESVRAEVSLVTERSGGAGAIRQIAEILIHNTHADRNPKGSHST